MKLEYGMWCADITVTNENFVQRSVERKRIHS